MDLVEISFVQVKEFVKNVIKRIQIRVQHAKIQLIVKVKLQIVLMGYVQLVPLTNIVQTSPQNAKQILKPVFNV